jgi:cell cycle checkpoint control protein RAD9A
LYHRKPRKYSNSSVEVLKKPLHTSIAVELDEFDDVDIEDRLHIVISVKDFRAIIQHAGTTSSDITARYSMPARPMQLCYQGDGITCEFLMMTVGERGNPGRKTKKKQQNGANAQNQLEATSRRTSVAPTEPPRPSINESATTRPAPVASMSSMAPLPRPSSHKLTNFQIRPSQMPPPSRLMSDGLFVDNDYEWEPVRDEDDDDDARIEWDQSYQPDHPVAPPTQDEGQEAQPEPAEASMDDLEPTQKLSEARKMALFYDGSV